MQKIGTFREWLREGENLVKYTKEIEKLLKEKFPKNFKDIPAIGSTLDLTFEYNNKKEASKSQNIDDILKVLNTLDTRLTLKLNKMSKDYKGGYDIQSTDWQKDSDSDKHDLYVSFIVV
jgi:hypothetical protein